MPSSLLQVPFIEFWTEPFVYGDWLLYLFHFRCQRISRLGQFSFFFNSSQLNKFSVLEFISIGKGMKARRHESRKLDNKMEDIQPKKEKSIFIIKFSFFFFIISWLHITFLIHCFFIKKKFCLSKNLGKWKKKNKNKSCFINSFSESHCHKKDEKNFPVPSVITADIRRCP